MNGELHMRSLKTQPGCRRHRAAGVQIATFVCFLLTTLVASPQALDDLIFTVGTTARSGGNDYSYVLIGSKDDSLLAGKTFAVFGKPGDPASAGTFTQRGVIQQRTDAASISALLNQSVPLGQDLASLSDALNMLLRRVPGITNQSLANKVLTAFTVARTNAQTAMFVKVLARSHPGMSLAIGHAFTEQISGVTTYEVREVNPLTGAPGDVLGRVTITPGAPVVMPAPGAPYQVMTNHPSDDLLIKLRWGTPDALRRLSLLGYGYNVWRMPRALAEANLFHTVPPTLSQLQASAARVNDAPVPASKLFPANGANDPTDRTTTFFSDDNGRARHFGQPNVGMFTFTNGQEFYYFITARDVLGRDGTPSPGGLGRACQRVAPNAPLGLEVRDHVMVTNTAGTTNTIQRFLVSWAQTTNQSEGTTHYWIYRWLNPASAFTNDLVPLSNRVGRVTHVAGPGNSFLDDNANSPTNTGPGVYWYTVRAVNEAACDPLLSPHSAPASGVLRERTGPAGTTGSVVGSCGTPAVTVTNQSFAAAPETNRYSYRFSATRRDPAIEWVRFYATNVTYYGEISVREFGPIYFGAEDEVTWEVSALNGSRISHIACVAGTVHGRVSAPRTAFLSANSSITLRESVTFMAGVVLLTAADPSDPLIAELNPGGGCYYVQSSQIDPSGVVFLTFQSYSGPAPLLIQSTAEGPNSANWINVGTAFPGSNGVYSLSYPACLYGPLPTFRGCVLPVAGEDCTDAIAGTDATGTAPLHIRFRLTPRTRQYRLYKQVDDGPLTLISQGATRFVSAAHQLVVPDDSMPVVSTRLCYYVQLLDEHGNASPMSFLGCKRVRRAGPARPVLAEPVSTGTIAAPKVLLSWFCPTSGVSRFRILIEEVNKPAESVFTPRPSRFSSLTLLRQTNAYPAGARFATRVSSALKFLQVQDTLLTPYLSDPAFGPGPQFTLEADIQADVQYRLSVAALDDGDKAGPISQVWEFIWKTPRPVSQVPWPARPLPPVNYFLSPWFGVFGGWFDSQPLSPRTFYNDFDGWNQTYPIGIRIGDIRGNTNIFTINHNSFTTNALAGYTVRWGAPERDPNIFLFRRSGSGGERAGQPLTPFVLYRRQLTNDVFPRVSGDIVQVSPLIEKIPYRITPWLRDYDIVTLSDPMFALGHESLGDYFNDYLYLRDLHPVTRGARYAYYLVRFKPNREVDEVVPVGEVEVKP